MEVSIVEVANYVLQRNSNWNDEQGRAYLSSQIAEEISKRLLTELGIWWLPVDIVPVLVSNDHDPTKVNFVDVKIISRTANVTFKLDLPEESSDES